MHSSSSKISLRFLQVVNITLDNIYDLACETAGSYVDSMHMLDGQHFTVSKFIDAFKNMDLNMMQEAPGELSDIRTSTLARLGSRHDLSLAHDESSSPRALQITLQIDGVTIRSRTKALNMLVPLSTLLVLMEGLGVQC